MSCGIVSLLEENCFTAPVTCEKCRMYVCIYLLQSVIALATLDLLSLRTHGQQWLCNTEFTRARTESAIIITITAALIHWNESSVAFYKCARWVCIHVDAVGTLINFLYSVSRLLIALWEWRALDNALVCGRVYSESLSSFERGAANACARPVPHEVDGRGKIAHLNSGD